MMTGSEELEKLHAAADAASARARASWITLISAVAYLAVVVLSTTHPQLVLEGSVRLPLLNVDLPLFTFYMVTPALLWVLHLSLLIQLYLLAGKLYRLNALLCQDLRLEADREQHRSRLDDFAFTQMLAGTRQGFVPALLLRLMILITVIALRESALSRHPCTSWRAALTGFLDSRAVR